MIFARVWLACVPALAALGLGASVSVAQGTRTVEGRVTRSTESGRPEPVARLWVVLHRVGSDGSGPLDSVRTDRSGRYRMRYQAFGDADALYFVSARYSGIAYFSAPLRAVAVRGGDGDVAVYATTPDTAALRVQGRHLVVSAPRGDRREVAEIFEIENSGFRTVIPRDSASPAWSTAIPERAESAAVSPADLSMTGVAIRRGRAEVFAPISPGVRQLVLTYQLPADAFPLSLPLRRSASVLEVLLEEPRAVVEGARLAEVAPAAIDRRMFRRFLAQEVDASAIMRVSAPPPVTQYRSALLVVAIGAAVAMIVALGVWFAARRSRAASVGRGEPDAEANVLIAALATLDSRFDVAAASDVARAEHESRRAALKERISRALARENSAA